ncbi:hypothetical protein SAMN05216210_2691 [Halopseudomonas salegens]|uniref:Uncharacterized protein n=1 Tax=Halopseudomonas salegens TaxID=1434072 RepID=A0A1H2H1F9_9GAMM|nr:hypothetical protein SAMN05216210_2691 [Halopseudomonas salegens]
MAGTPSTSYMDVLAACPVVGNPAIASSQIKTPIFSRATTGRFKQRTTEQELNRQHPTKQRLDITCFRNSRMQRVIRALEAAFGNDQVAVEMTR